ncbi:hypothetical protein FM038_001600 [Shewanella eurypsychrophilus]|uniref:Uncharacterized protein n=1 Tax=Shewanella eurypsychrophilus TaxID=2593656 RepID=A0ABX6V6V5_9GAMM|nr:MULTISPECIES: hypothetical protein [Shewanella]QFU20694.1 hypothetical protein FS418_01580 [Shewanella sp. YLB-09]QFU20974.1 hypothetical protein FS418_03190 [Shewanella sp. YLB-09]QPG56262.1 hypothetical protein FM038_001600 [Shewanella eurypsychrophilus]
MPNSSDSKADLISKKSKQLEVISIISQSGNIDELSSLHIESLFQLTYELSNEITEIASSNNI